ncbi:MAG: elongation factor Ts [Candidatus Omnitrophica bacterium]|nr:elongation factor Ts [Candidatus Omnitrophota bacterium]
MAISVDSVKELRERTGAGMMDCKAALDAVAGDMEKAVDFLRKKGIAKAANRAGRQAREGLVVSKIAGHKAAIVEANCETDFVARTEDFRKLAMLALEEVLAAGEQAVHSEKVTRRIGELSGKIGEKIVVRRAKAIESKDGILFTYIHSNHKLGVLVELASEKGGSHPALEECGKHVAMQIAASNPISVTRAEIPASTLERERAIFREEVKGKPDNIVEKIVQGKLDKFYKASCLLEQPFIKDDAVSVQRVLDETGKKIGAAVKVRGFVRFQLGETAVAD